MSIIQTTPPIAVRIRRARLEAGMLQSELAHQVGRSTRSIQAWEAGDSIPRGSAIRTLAFVTGKTVAWFYQDETEL